MDIAEMPQTRYARAPDGVRLAYHVFGDGPVDLVMVQGYISHLELSWESPAYQRMMERLSSFARVIVFDKRGVGLSDPVEELPTLEQRMEDVGVIMNAVGIEHAVLFGNSEGGMMCALFAATYPERTDGLILYGTMPRSVQDDDYPWASSREAVMESAMLLSEHFGEGATLEIFSPSVADMPGARQLAGKMERYGASPAAADKLHEMFLDMDIRDVLPSIRVPTLVLHRRGDRVVNVRAARWMAERIPGARYVELAGIDHTMVAGDIDSILDEVQEFVTGTRERSEPDRVLLTVMFTDIVRSTERAAEMGDRAWRDQLADHSSMMRRELERFRGREIKTLGDGFLASFDGPARAIRCGLSAVRAAAAAGFPIRVGIHTGECEVVGDDIAGVTVHIAARVSAKAGDSEVLVSRTVKDLVAGSGIVFEDRGTHTLKGIPDEWRLFAVASGPTG